MRLQQRAEKIATESAAAERLGGEPRARLLSWYEQNQRALPWRTKSGEGADPYVVLVSEMMLQQTQVEVVRARFLEFVERFPGVHDLARASEDDVLEAWSGLGYYRRARFLHQAAKEIEARGSFPKTAVALRQLTGVGEYTAAAIASIAFSEAEPVLDGNVERVLSRVQREAGNPKHKATRDRLSLAAAELLDPMRPGASNQAMMELGALVCRQRDPHCEECPLGSTCLARAAGRQTDFPTVRPKPERKKAVWRQQVVLTNGAAGPELLLDRRSSSASILAGRWLLPTVEPLSASTRPDLEKRSEPGGQAEREIGRFKHSITVTDYQVVLQLAEHADAPAKEHAGVEVGQDDPSRRWVALSEFGPDGRWQGLAALPTSSLLHKAIKIIRVYLSGRI